MRRSVDGKAAAIMVVLCSIWGLHQVALKAAAVDVPTIYQVALRSGASALLVWAFARLVEREPWLPGVVRPGLVVGGLFAIEFLFIAEGLRWTTASHMAVFIYTAPMFAAVGLQLRLPDERLSAAQWLGLAVAFLGVVVTFLGPADASSSSSLVGDLLGLCAGASWGLTTVAIRTSKLSEAPATQALFYQLSAAFVVLLAVAAATGAVRFHSTPLAWGSLAFQAVVVSFASYLVWFQLLRRYRAAQLGVLSFMTPLFGVAMAAALLADPLTPSFLAGAMLVVTGLLLVNAPKRWTRT